MKIILILVRSQLILFIYLAMLNILCVKNLSAQTCPELPPVGVINFDNIFTSIYNPSTCSYTVDSISMELYGLNEMKVCRNPSSDPLSGFRVYGVIIKKKDISKKFKFEDDLFPIDSVHISISEIECGLHPESVLFYNDGSVIRKTSTSFGISNYDKLDSLYIGEKECGLLRGRIFPNMEPISVTIQPFRNNTKWGKLYNIKADLTSGRLSKIPIIGRYVNLYSEDNDNVPIATALTDNEGNFEFCADMTKNYTISANYFDYKIKTTISKTNEGCKIGECELKIPEGLVKQINSDLNDNLRNIELSFPISNTTSITIPGYSLSNSEDFLLESKNIEGKLNEKIEGIGRFLIVEQTLHKYLEQAKPLNDIEVKNVVDLANFALSLFLAIKSVDNFYTNCPLCQIIFPFDKKEFDKKVFDLYKNTASRMSSDDYINIYEFYRMLEDITDSYVADKVKAVVSNSNITEYYIKENTQSLLDNSIISAKSFTEDSGFSDALNTSNNNVLVSENLSDISISKANSHIETAEMASRIESALDLAADVSLMTPGSQEFVPALKALAYLAQATNISFTILSYHTADKRLKQLSDEVSASVGNTFRNRINPLDYYNYFVINEELNADVNLKVNEYNNQLFNIITDIDNNKMHLAAQKFQRLQTLDSELELSVREASRPLLAAQLSGASSLSDSAFFKGLDHSFSISPFNRLGLSFYFLAIVQDSLNSALLQDFKEYANKSIVYNNKIINELDTISLFLRDTPSPAYVAVSSNEIPNQVLGNSNTLSKIKIKNYGQTKASNFFVKTDISSPFLITTDSIWIDSLLPQAELSLTIPIKAPNIDTVATYSIRFLGEQLNSIPDIGTVQSFVITTSTKENNYIDEPKITLSPNPNNGHFKINFDEDFKIDDFKNLSLKIFSIDGALRFEKFYSNINYLNNSIIDLNGLSNGMYFLHLKSMNGYGTTIKFIIN
jgi:hypothetical protein